MSKFGKWEYSDSSMISIPTSLLPTIARNWYRIYDRKEKTGIALVPLENNASLIANAPELYEMLDKLVEAIDSVDTVNGLFPFGFGIVKIRSELVKDAKALLARINGEEKQNAGTDNAQN